MSSESAELFIKRMNNDEDFSIMVCEAKDAKARMAFVKMNGFDFSASEILEISSKYTNEDLVIASSRERLCCTYDAYDDRVAMRAHSQYTLTS